MIKRLLLLLLIGGLLLSAAWVYSEHIFAILMASLDIIMGMDEKLKSAIGNLGAFLAYIFTLVGGLVLAIRQYLVGKQEGTETTEIRQQSGDDSINPIVTGNNNPIHISVTRNYGPNASPQFNEGELQEQLVEYRRYIIETYQYLDFKGMDVIEDSMKSSSGLGLEAVYVPLRARLDTPEYETWHRLGGRFYCLAKATATIDEDKLEQEMERTEAQALPVEQWHQQQAALLILGDPGSGKSTTLKRLALALARGGDTPLPILLPLNEYGKTLNERAISLDDYLPEYFDAKRSQLDQAKLKRLFGQALKHGKAVVLLDGLDEVGGNRGQVVGQVENFARAWIPEKESTTTPVNRLVVTSRFVGYRDYPLTDPRWKTVALNDWNRDEIGHFFAAFTLANELVRSGGENREQCNSLARQECEALLQVIDNNRGIRRLAGNPLLASLLALIKRLKVVLPHRRVELYMRYMETMLCTWNRCRSLDKQPIGPEIDFYPTQKLLAKLALHLRKTNPQGGLIHEDAMREYLLKYFIDDGFSRESADDHARGFLASVHKYSNLLIQKGYRQYGFIHLTFEEYLAGVGLAAEDEKSLGELIPDYLQNTGQWKETLLLSLGYMAVFGTDQIKPNAVLRHLLSTREPRLILFAGEVLNDVGPKALSNLMATDIRHALQALMQATEADLPSRAEAGRLLGETGDPRPGVTVQKDNGQVIWRMRGQHKHALPDIDWQEIPAGSFRMGSEENKGEARERPAHTVAMARYFISRNPVTNAQYRCFMDAGMYEDEAFWRERLPEAAYLWRQGGAADEQLLAGLDKNTADLYRKWLADDKDRSRPRFWSDRQWNLDNHPVVGVSWFEALAYTVWLNDCLAAQMPSHGEAGPPLTIRLPTEAEWEYAARGGLGLEYAWGKGENPALGNYDGTKLGRTTAVGLFPPGEAFGLYDMSGNVWEWTLSRWGKNAAKPDFTYQDWQKQEKTRNLVGPVEFRVVRGGAWSNQAGVVRCAYRNWNLPSDRNSYVGFRVVLGGVLPGDF